MLLVLSGAKKNVGDFLIVDRTLRLLEDVLGEEVVVHPRWQSLDGMEELVARARAVVIAGGPGVLPKMYPQIYPLFSDPAKLRELGTDIRFLGVGWFAMRGDAAEMRDFAFSDSTASFLDAMGARASFATRDKKTARLLEMKGVSDVTFSGCPVWYDLRHPDDPYRRPAEIKTVVFTTPQGAQYEGQSLALLRSTMQRFEGARVIVAFHRGIDQVDEWTTPEEAARFTRMAKVAAELGAEVRDVSYDLSKISFYDECDVHVGYRVHAHLYFLSGRKPSFLLEEDGRGRGFAEVLQAPSITAWEYTPYGRSLARVIPRLPARVRRRLPITRFKSTAVAETLSAIDGFIGGDDAPFEATVETFRQTYPSMRDFIERI